MFKSIYSKFILGYLLFGMIGFLTIALFSDRMTYEYLVRNEAKRLYDEAVFMAESYEESSYYMGDINASVTGDIRLVAKFLKAEIWVTNSEGRIILDTAGCHNGKLIENFDPASVSSYYQTGFYNGAFSTEMLSVEVPVTHNFSPIGYLLIHYPLSGVVSSKNEILNIVYITSAIIFMLSLIILLVFNHYVYVPLRHITGAAEEYRSGNLAYKLQHHFANDEVGSLAKTLEVMATDLASTEETQRNFIANVSHDFRSPLTSIRGFLEAILDGTIPEERVPKYIGLIISETERLSKLTENMLTLNSVGRTASLNRSNFDINDTIRKVCNANESRCLQKNISFDLTFEDEKEMVHADFSGIQQVLYNLIDNAVKFSGKDSVIYISTIRKSRKIFVSVKDTGIGIPRDSINKIWDRFYKTDISRGRDKTGTGLGLSIVREIIQAHNETIDVVSTEGVGTEFTFSLPMSDF